MATNGCHGAIWPRRHLTRRSASRRLVPSLASRAARVASGQDRSSSTEPYTDAPSEAVAQLVAAASKALSIPVDRNTVLVHADLHSVSRRSDPWPPATREQRVRRAIARANALLRPPIVTVTVKAGDTLSGIATDRGLTLKALLAYPENAEYRANPGSSTRGATGATRLG